MEATSAGPETLLLEAPAGLGEDLEEQATAFLDQPPSTARPKWDLRVPWRGAIVLLCGVALLAALFAGAGIAVSPGGFVSMQEDLSEYFKDFDRDGDSGFDLEEATDAMVEHEPSITDEEIEDEFNEADADHDGKVTLDELQDVAQESDDEDLFTMMNFTDMDTDGSGSIDMKEASDAMVKEDPSMANEQIEDLFADADTDEDGEVTFHEFQEYAEDSDDNEEYAEDSDDNDLITDMDTDGSDSIDMKEATDAIAEHEPDITVEEIEDEFNEADADHDGEMTFDELHDYAEYNDYNDLFMTMNFTDMDTDGGGSIDMKEATDAMMESDPEVTDEEIEDLFNDADTDEDGEVTSDEFQDYAEASPPSPS